MSLTSLTFLIFCLGLVLVYYLAPRRFQWPILLAASLLFYSMAGIRNVIFILITSLSTYSATLLMEKLALEHKSWVKENKKTTTREERNLRKEQVKRKRKWIMIAALVLNFGIMCTFKYVHFALEQFNALAGLFGGSGVEDTIQWIIPLGISFYTFQTMGYLVDVYWEKTAAEHNYGKVLLFVSFFPQMTQGPISNFADLTGELFREHTFSYHRYSWGIQRMIWGFFKKIVVADVLAVSVRDVFANYSTYAGITTLIGAFLYSIQIYADFSGYMDIVCGLCEVLDIRLTENFLRPYFSKSIAEYWRRWHSSLGTWFKNYVYYPLAVARWNQNIGKAARKKFGKTVGQTVPASIALVGVWLTTGLWHGASWAYIAWGGVNGLFIIFSLWMEPVYDSWKAKLHINEAGRRWVAFQTIRTFILVTFIKVLPEVGTLSQGWGLWVHIFTDFTIPRSIGALLPEVKGMMFFCMAMGGTLLMFLTSMIQRRQPIRQWLEDHVPYYGRILIYAVMTVVIFYVYYKFSDVEGGFMYAQF